MALAPDAVDGFSQSQQTIVLKERLIEKGYIKRSVHRGGSVEIDRSEDGCNEFDILL